MNISLRSYIIGFVTSIALTLGAYALVVSDALARAETLTVIVVLALLQIAVQLVCFLHLGAETDRWRGATFGFAALMTAIVIGGSLWIMSNLNERMMQMTPSEVEHYMADQS